MRSWQRMQLWRKSFKVLDKDFAEKNGTSADDAAMREKAAEAIVLPLAKAAGLPFTLEELKEYEQEQLQEIQLSEDEMEQVAGGKARMGYGGSGGGASTGKDSGAFCAFLGVGFGKSKKNGKTAYCFLLGGSNGPIAV